MCWVCLYNVHDCLLLLLPFLSHLPPPHPSPFSSFSLSTEDSRNGGQVHASWVPALWATLEVITSQSTLADNNHITMNSTFLSVDPKYVMSLGSTVWGVTLSVSHPQTVWLCNYQLLLIIDINFFWNNWLVAHTSYTAHSAQCLCVV